MQWHMFLTGEPHILIPVSGGEDSAECRIMAEAIDRWIAAWDREFGYMDRQWSKRRFVNYDEL